MAVKNNQQHREELLRAFEYSTRDKEKAVELLRVTEKPAEIIDDYNSTLLHHAAFNGWADISRQLVEIHHADPHVKGSNGETALHWACSRNRTDIVQYLVNSVHCDPLLKNNSGYTPFDKTGSGESRDFLLDIIAKAKKEGQSVVEYTKSVSNRGGVIDYTPYLERAAAQGTVTTRLSSIGLFGAAGTGKSSTARLLTDQEPVHEHDSTPVMKPEEYYKATEDTGGTSDTDEDSDWDSEPENDEPAPRPPEVQQRVRAAKQEVLIAAELKRGKIKEWMPATKEVLIERFGNCVATLATQQQAGTTQGATSSSESCLLIEGFSIDKKTEVQPISSVGGKKAGASVTRQKKRHACVIKVTQDILKFVKSREDLQKLGITHFVSLCDTGGQAAFLDIAPALLRFNSVNLVLLKLNEKLNDPAKFFYSVKGQTVGHENRQMTTRSLVRSMVSCKSKIMPPRISKDKLIEGSQYRKPVFMILGTHLDEYIKIKEASGTCPQSKEEMNAILECDLSDFKDCIHQRENKMMYTLNTMARDPATKKLASIIREKVMESYVEVEIPASWYIFHLAMLEIKQSNKKSYGMISLSVLYSVGAMLAQIPPEEVQATLQYFHDLHVCLYYPTVASNVVFTDPQFLFDKISEIFALSQGKGRSRVSNNEFNKLSEHGKFNKSILGSICKGFSKIFTKNEFLSLLCHLFIVSKIPNAVGEYFMPSLLPELPVPSKHDELSKFLTSHSSPSIEPLLLSWDGVPHGLFTSLTTSIQAAEGVNNIHFTMSPQDRQYRNVITLNCPDLACQVKLIECTTFVAVAVLFSRSEVITNQCIKLRRAILSCIDKIEEKFNWMPLSPHLKEAFLCNLEQCTSQDDVHFCLLDASHKKISCAGSSLVTAPAHPDAHLVWWEEIGNSDDPSHTQSICKAVIKALDTRLDSLSYAVAGSIDTLSRKLYAKSLIPEPVKDDPTKSFDSLLKCFKACIRLEQSPGNVTRKARDFITALEEIGGGLATAANAIRKDINKELGSTSPFMTDHIETIDTFEVSDTDGQSEASPSITVDKSTTAEAKKQSPSTVDMSTTAEAKEQSPSTVDKSVTAEAKAVTKQSQTSCRPEIENMTVEEGPTQRSHKCCTLL